MKRTAEGDRVRSPFEIQTEKALTEAQRYVEARGVFERCTSYDELETLMLRAVEKQIPWPFNDFAIPGQEGDELTWWWEEGTDRYELFKQMHGAGLIVTSVQEDTIPEDAQGCPPQPNAGEDVIIEQNTRGSVTFYCPDKIVKRLTVALKKESFAVIDRSDDTAGHREYERSITIAENITEDYAVDVLQRAQFTLKAHGRPGVPMGERPNNLERIMNKDHNEFLAHVPVIQVIDLRLNRAVDYMPTGLFRRIVHHVRLFLDEDAEEQDE